MNELVYTTTGNGIEFYQHRNERVDSVKYRTVALSSDTLAIIEADRNVARRADVD